MSRFTNVKVIISQGQIDKIKRAIQTGSQVSIRLSHSDLNGEHVLVLTDAQVAKLQKAYHSGAGVTIKMSNRQLQHNSRIEGGFIGALLPKLAIAGKFLLSCVLPTLATGVLSGIGSAAESTAVNKIAGNGIVYVKKNGMGLKMRAAGDGLYLRPWADGNSYGERMFLKSGPGYEAIGSGLLLGPNSPFANIPIIGAIL